jgi:phenylacetate-CoA ligase
MSSNRDERLVDNLSGALTRHVIFPLWAMRDHPGLNAFFREYESTQFWSPDRIRELQWQRLQKIVRFAFDQCPYYTRRFREVGIHPDDLREPGDQLRLPVLTKQDIRQHLPDLIARGVAPDSYVDNYTGGSSGSPISFKVSKRRWASRQAMTLRHDYWCGWRIGKKKGVLWGHPNEQADNTTWGRFRNALLYREILLNTFDIKEANLDQFIRELNRQNVRYLQAYSRSLLLFAQYLTEQRVEPPRLKAIITSAECLSPSERSFIEQTLRCRTFDRYGCREFSVIASECEAHEGLHLAAETMLVEFVVGDRPARSGEVGEIAVTDLLNEATPFIRYKIGDLGATMEGACSCGRGLPRMQMVAGRVTDFIHTPAGRWVSGVAITTYLISQMPGVRQTQILQDRCDHLCFRLVASGQDGMAAENFLREQVPKMFGPGMRYSIEWVNRIPPEASGKMRVTISECFSAHGFREASTDSGGIGVPEGR